VIARAERRRRAYTLEEIRERLHARLAEASRTRPPARDLGQTPQGAGTGRAWLRLLLAPVAVTAGGVCAWRRKPAGRPGVRRRS